MKWWVPVSLMALALGIGFCGLEWSARRSEAEWTEFRATWEARGESFGVVENLPLPRVETEEFAAHPWIRGLADGDLAILARLEGMSPDDIDGFDDWQARSDENDILPIMPDDVAVLVQQRGEEYKAELDAYSAAMERPGSCVISGGDGEGFEDTLWLGKLSAVSKLLDALSYAALATDDAAEFTRLVTLEMQAGEKLRATNLMIGIVVGSGSEAGAWRAMTNAEATGKWPATERVKCLAALDLRNRPIADEFAAAIRVERGNFLELIATLEQTGGSPDSVSLSGISAVRRKFFADSRLALCREFQETVLADGEKLASAIDSAKLKQFMDSIKSRKKESRAESFGNLPFFLIGGILDPLTQMESDREEIRAKLAAATN